MTTRHAAQRHARKPHARKPHASLTRARRGREDSGLASIEFVILLPAFVLLIMLAIYFGRTELAKASVEMAAQDAARAASEQRTRPAAETAAQQAAADTLNADGSPCAAGSVVATITNPQSPDPFDTPLGTASSVHVHVTCEVLLSDLIIPGVPGSVIMSDDFSSPIDSYRIRTDSTPAPAP